MLKRWPLRSFFCRFRHPVVRPVQGKNAERRKRQTKREGPTLHFEPNQVGANRQATAEQRTDY
jgi:hypothetical protein